MKPRLSGVLSVSKALSGIVILILWAMVLPVEAQSPGAGTAEWPFSSGDQQKEELSDNLTARNFVLVFDGSGSMSEKKCSGRRTKLEVAKDAVVDWSESVPPDANMGLVSFHGNGWSRVPLAAQNREGFIKLVQGIVAGGGTPLDQAMSSAYEMLTKQAQRQLGYGTYTIVVVTDGIANDPSALMKAVNRILGNTPIVIYTIGFCIGNRHSLNQRGRTIYKTADDAQSLRRGLRDVLAESAAFDVSDFRK